MITRVPAATPAKKTPTARHQAPGTEEKPNQKKHTVAGPENKRTFERWTKSKKDKDE